MQSLHTVLKDRPCGVPAAHVYKSEDSLDTGPETTLLLDGQPWEDYLERNGVGFNVHEEMGRNVPTLTQKGENVHKKQETTQQKWTTTSFSLSVQDTYMVYYGLTLTL